VILEKLGEGAMGEVYRAHDEELDREVAVKVMRPELSLDAERIKRFEREAKAVGRLRHPNVVTVFDVGTHEGVPYVVTELLDGRTLRALLDEGPASVATAAGMAVQMASALHAVHERGIVHRDLKPENVFVTGDGRIKLLDFGVAKLMLSSATGSESTLSLETMPGALVGTVGYMAPEQVRGEPVDPRADLFSLGAILFELVEGVRAFGGETPVERLAAILKEHPPDVLAGRDGPRERAYREVVRRCLEKDREARYPSAEDVREALLAVVAEAKLDARPGSPPTREVGSKRSARVALVALPLLVGAFVVGRWSTRTTERTAGDALPTPSTAVMAPASVAPPKFSRLTYASGGIASARFTPDGHSVVFGAFFGGDALRVHTLRTESPAMLPLDVAGDVLAVSSQGEMAVSLGRRLAPWPAEGTLARSPLLGGAPREIATDVLDADFERDGEDLVVVRRTGEKTTIERPLGHVVYSTAGSISHLRVDRRSGRVAFFLHPYALDTMGKVALLDEAGGVTELSETFMDLNGLAWSPAGTEVWFSGAPAAGPFELAAVDLEGHRRRLFQGPGRVVLHDVAPDGRALVTVDDWRGVAVSAAPGGLERELSVLDNSVLMDLSPDGARALLSEQSAGGRPSYDVYLRPTSGGAPTLLGEGLATSVSPSGAWVASLITGPEPALDLLPTVAGTKRRFVRPALTFFAAQFSGTDDQLVVVASEGDKPRRVYVVDVTQDAAPRPISPPGPWLELAASRDGSVVLCRKQDGEIWAFSPKDDAAPKRITTLPKGHTLGRPATASKAYVLRRGARPGEVLELDLESGKLSHHATLAPRDLTGYVEASTFVGTPSPDRFGYTYFRQLSTLFVLDGLGA
jgi:serine/threonine protein kinase